MNSNLHRFMSLFLTIFLLKTGQSKDGTVDDFFVTILADGNIAKHRNMTQSASGIYYEYTDNEKLTLSCTSLISHSLGSNTTLKMLFTLDGSRKQSEIYKDDWVWCIRKTFILKAGHNESVIKCHRWLMNGYSAIILKLRHKEPPLITNPDTVEKDSSIDDSNNKGNNFIDDSTYVALIVAPFIGVIILLTIIVVLLLKFKKRTTEPPYKVEHNVSSVSNYTHSQTGAASDIKKSRRLEEESLLHTNDYITINESPDTTEIPIYHETYFEPNFRVFSNNYEYTGDSHGDMIGDSVFDTVLARIERANAKRVDNHYKENFKESELEDSNEYCNMYPIRR